MSNHRISPAAHPPNCRGSGQPAAPGDHAQMTRCLYCSAFWVHWENPTITPTHPPRRWGDHQREEPSMTECSNPEDRPLSVVFFDYTRLAGRIVEVAWKRFTLHDLFVETETDTYSKPLVNLEGDGPAIEHAWLFPGYWFERAPSAADLDTMRQSGVLDRYHTAVTATAAEPDPNQTAAPAFHPSDGFVRLIGDLVAGSMLVSLDPRRMIGDLNQLPTVESGPQPQVPEPDAILDLLSLTQESWWRAPAGLDPLDSEQMMDRAVGFRFLSDKQDADTPTGRVDEAYRAACGAFTGPDSFHQWAHAVMCNADHTQTDTEEA